ncbi:acyl dehydratase [Amycolatopsis sp. K13G38]|uniref:Acyl dehydratase n=1 Tax=Amycolatopsis acididurans TaxID=2724524 RepID=A0ABX1IWM5_9PSEU|nr:MaoC/PaaZ C-terminal domain-containing protein [Amycolatopsis acididurans]NKQ51893.1 acyl dehydratase [Amycolatopsis acididurans]
MRPPVPVQPGHQLPVREIGPVTQTHIVRFAGAGGDFNPLHHDPAFAVKAGFPGVLAMGQMHAGMLASWLSDWAGAEHLREFEVRFVAPVFLGDVLRLSGEVVGVEDHIAELTLAAARGEDEVIRARARVLTA